MADLTLEKAKTLVRQREAVHEQQLALNGSTKMDRSLDSVQKRTLNSKGRSQPQRKVPISTFQHPATKCSRCGRGPHPRHQCPARDSECHKCHKQGHYSAQCFSKSVREIHDPPESDDFAFLNTVGSDRGTFWTCTISVNGQNVPFKVDTGAEVTVISEKYAKLLSQDLQPPSKRLHGPDRQPLSVMGEITTAMTYKDKQVTQTIFVVRNLQYNLVGLPAIRALGILTRIEAISVPIKEQFPSLFTGLGTFHGSSYEIQLKPDSKPFALFTPRNVPLPLRDKVKDELARMEALDIIAPVEEPTPWCAGMVVVPKKSNQVRICVDFRALNESVLREVHPLPKVDETLAQMAGATVFSKLDANCGFWQIPLSENCQKLTTFITPFGRYYFKRLPFGICSAPEYFQRRMSAILEGHDEVLCHMDDVFIFGQDHDEHDTRLRAALQSIQEAGVTLNPDKCEFSRGSITFLGHVIDANGISADPSKTQAVMDMERPKNIAELRRFMGMANQLGKFSPKLAELSQSSHTPKPSSSMVVGSSSRGRLQCNQVRAGNPYHTSTV